MRYGYADGTQNTIRRTAITYPDVATVLTISYPAGAADALSPPGSEGIYRQFYYDDRWRILEDRLGDGTTVDRQYT